MSLAASAALVAADVAIHLSVVGVSAAFQPVATARYLAKGLWGALPSIYPKKAPTAAELAAAAAAAAAAPPPK